MSDFAISCDGKDSVVSFPSYKTALNSFIDVSYTAWIEAVFDQIEYLLSADFQTPDVKLFAVVSGQIAYA
jgi:hypothetical protein